MNNSNITVPALVRIVVFSLVLLYHIVTLHCNIIVAFTYVEEKIVIIIDREITVTFWQQG